jgi:hypothetical protein
MSLETELSPKYRDMFLDPIFQHDFKVLSKRLIKKDPEYREEIKDIIKEVEESFDASLVTSELRPIQRIAIIESTLGVNGTIDYEDDERELSVLEKIDSIEDKLDNFKTLPSESPRIEIKPKTKTGTRALHLITKLKASGKDHLTHKEIKSILTEELPEDCRIDARSSNPRKLIIDVLNEAATICSDVFLDKKTRGHKEWRMGLKS